MIKKETSEEEERCKTIVTAYCKFKYLLLSTLPEQFFPYISAIADGG